MNIPDLSVIIPLYNESARLPVAMQKLANYPTTRRAEVILVENGCTDNTHAIAMEMCDHYPFMTIKVMTSAPGKGAAVRAGMLAATRNFRYMADVDFSTPVTELDKFLDAARRYHIVIGSRYMPGQRAALSLKRRITASAFSVVAQPITGAYDSQCGFKLFHAQSARWIFNRARLDGWAFDVEVLRLARLGGFEFHEMPVRWHPDDDSRVNIWRDAPHMAIDALRASAMRYDIE